MPTLNWIGKEAVVTHHHDVPFKTLEKQYTFGADSSENKIIHGDNLEALKALLPEYEGRIKCIYIDPPYNTGNENWVYNDNVNSPKIQKWLGQVVGKEAEDLSRHDKWLCMMYPRLKLLHQLLADDGAIFISIDDNEQANLKLLCDEIFGSGNFISTCIRRKNKLVMKGDKTFKCVIEPLIVYAKDKSNLEFAYASDNIIESDFSVASAGYGDKEVRFLPQELKFRMEEGIVPAGQYKSFNVKEDIIVKNFFNINSVSIIGEFKWSEKKIREKIQNNAYILVKDVSSMSMRIYFESNTAKPLDYIDEKYGVVTNEAGIKELESLGFKNKFDYPKPVDYIKFLLNIINDKSAIILDSFAGSGTTAHAVLNLNKQDGGNRKFILVEMEDYAETITAERVKRVINGYGEGKNAVEGTRGSFSYYELGEPIFTDDQNLNESVGVEKLREYIWYSETRVPYCRDVVHRVSSGNEQSYLLGNHDGTDYYFYYEPDRITTLSHDTLNIVERKADTYVVYADQCVIDKEWLNNHHIIFKKIPRDIRRF